MRRLIVGFHRDEDGDWVADLSCLHTQHVRHRPPFQERPWVSDETERAARVGAELDCPLCDRAEMPEGLRLVRTAGPFDADTLPPALRKQHRVAEKTWGRLRVDEGSVWFTGNLRSFRTPVRPKGTQVRRPSGMPAMSAGSRCKVDRLEVARYPRLCG